jgi:hypothetical protein
LLEAVGFWEASRLPFEAAWERGVKLTRKHGQVRSDWSTEEGFPLGAWQGQQQAAYKKGLLPEERATLLKGVPGWTWDRKEASWMRFWSLTKHYGNVRVHYVTEDGAKLGSWQNRQRRAHRRGSLSEERTLLLESIPEWRWTWSSYSGPWERHYELSKRSGVVPDYFITPEGIALGRWQSRQRRSYRHGELSEERSRLLASIDHWEWDLSYRKAVGFGKKEEKWHSTRQALLEFVERNNRFPRTNEAPLGNWIAAQRTQYWAGKFSEQRAKLLDDIPGWQWRNRGRVKRWTESDDARLVRLLSEGLTYSDIAQRMDTTAKAVAWRVHKLDLQAR